MIVLKEPENVENSEIEYVKVEAQKRKEADVFQQIE